MKEEFDINIKDNFIEPSIYNSIYDKIPYYTYSADSHAYINDEDKEHLFYAHPVEKNIAKYIKEKCEKLYGKKLEITYCSYTMVSRSTPMVHCDYEKNKTNYQIIVYIKGDRGLNRGTGFYVTNEKNEQELNTHIGFKENRAIFWYSPVFHSPLIWSDENKNKRFSIIAQYKEIK